MKTKILLLFFLQSLCYVQLPAQTVDKAMSLKMAVQYALSENTDIKKQNLAIVQSKYRVQEIQGMQLPQITGSAQFTDNLQVQKSLLPGEIFGQPGTYVSVQFGVITE